MHTGLVESICRSLFRYMQQARAASHLVSLSNLKITQDLFPFLFGFLDILYRVILDLDFIFHGSLSRPPSKGPRFVGFHGNRNILYVAALIPCC